MQKALKAFFRISSGGETMTEDCYDFEYVRAREFEAIETVRKDTPGSRWRRNEPMHALKPLNVRPRTCL
jgi:hypothetical protein